MAKEQPRFLAVLPWLRLKEEIEVGPVVFWRWPKDKNKYIRRRELQSSISTVLEEDFADLKRVKDNVWETEPLDSFCLASIKEDSPFINWKQLHLIHNAVEALNACALFATDVQKEISKSKTGENIKSITINFYSNSTDFDLYFVSLDQLYCFLERRRYGREVVDSPIVKPRACTIKPPSGGKMDGEIQDWYLGLRGNLPLLRALGELLKSKASNFQRRVFRALSWLNLACTDLREEQQFSEIVILSTAFEILLNLHNVHSEERKEKLGERLQKLFADSKKIKGASNGKPWKVLWIQVFYGLRNDIVHGKEIDQERLNWQQSPNVESHTEVAILVFRLTLTKLLKKEKFYEAETEEERFLADNLDKFLSYKDVPREKILRIKYSKPIKLSVRGHS